MQKLMTVREVADSLRVKPLAVLRWIRAKELAAVNVARRVAGKRPSWRIEAGEVQRWASGRTPVAKVATRRRQPAVGVTEYF